MSMWQSYLEQAHRLILSYWQYIYVVTLSANSAEYAYLFRQLFLTQLVQCVKLLSKQNVF